MPVKDEEKPLGDALLGHGRRSSWDGRDSDDNLSSDTHFLGTPKAKRHVWFVHAVFFALNIIIFFSNTYIYRENKYICGPRHGVDFVYSPAREAVTYEARTFNTSLFARNKFNGDPRPESSEAWESISEAGNFVLSDDDLHKLNRTSVPVENGYLGTIGMFHQLHCLNYIRKHIYKDYYDNPEDPHTIKMHLSHCIDDLRQTIQCQGDISILTYSYRPDYINVWPDFQGEHECRNFEQIRKWVLSPARFLRFPNTFVNPYFGPNGQQTTPIPSSIEGSTELVSGTRLNPKVMKLAGGEPY